MTHIEIRSKFLDFMKRKGHAIVPSSSLLPDDPSVLFTTAGMQQFKKYYTGEADAMKDFGSLNTASIQKSMRTSDIDEVGDDSHLTFFEMLGNFSFGGYWKKEAITYGHEFITKEMGLAIGYVTVFAGEPGVPEDTESQEIWKSLDPNLEIRKCGREDNFWGPTGNKGPCGPNTDIFINDTEVWAIVFNEFFQDEHGKLSELKVKGIDTGMGLERLAMVVQDKKNIFETDLFAFAKDKSRIVADHARAIAFLISDGILPSNKDQGYVLRRLMRRLLAKKNDYDLIFDEVIKIYKPLYDNLDSKRVHEVWAEEAAKFSKTLDSGLRELKKIQNLDATAAFKLYESYGLPFEVMHDAVPTLNRETFDEEFRKHQAKSREGSVKKFGGHGLLLDTGELKAANEEELVKVTRLHTATHMLQAALRKVLGDEVHQAGSDITAERLRFDFTFSRKVTPEELGKVEDLINDAIRRDLTVSYVEMPIEEAKKTGALYFFKEKYPERVKVYTVDGFSKEFCGGPHVGHTGEIGGVTITKEESVSAGVRRIRASLK